MSLASSTLPATRPPTPEELKDAILSAFEGDIRRVRSPLTYKAGVMLVAAVMVLLPLVYLALLGAVGCGVYYHTVYHVKVLEALKGPAGAVAYVAPLFVGVVLLLFMLKPLLSRPARRSPPLALVPEEEPLLFAFVERVCRAVRAPVPRRIDVDCNVNAAAGFRQGAWSMLGNDLVLLIGLPLVAGLNLRQFSGVLAHEFGHFTQGVGMRLTYVIRAVNFWFMRVVYERDKWDQRLTELARQGSLRWSFLAHLAQAFVWLTRRVLWVLMMVGHAVGGYLLRQMELDADRHLARLVGSDPFEAMTRRLAVLHFAGQGAQADVATFLREGRLVDDLPRLIAANVGQLPPEMLNLIADMADFSRTGWLDTHPCDQERMAGVRLEKAPGVFRLEMPAAVLFADFPATAKAATWNYYREALGDRARRDDVAPVEELMERQQQDKRSYEALGRYLQAHASPLRALRLPRWTLEPPAELAPAVARLRALRARMRADLPRYRQVFKCFDHADTRLLETEQALALRGAGIRVRKGEPPFRLPSRSEVMRVQRALRARQGDLVAELEPLESVAGERLLAALDLLGYPFGADQGPRAARDQSQCARLLSAARATEGEAGALIGLRNGLAVLGLLFSKVRGHQPDPKLVREMQAQARTLQGELRHLVKRLGATAYPFDHPKGAISLGAYVLAEGPEAENTGAVFAAADSALRSLTMLRARVVGRLCELGEAVETSVGLEPWPQPPG
jgi:Zn-dependent protease with chaperone function